MKKVQQKFRIHRMPRRETINLATDYIESAKPELMAEGLEPVQCANGHWTTKDDLDEQMCCGQCQCQEEFTEE